MLSKFILKDIVSSNTCFTHYNDELINVLYSKRSLKQIISHNLVALFTSSYLP